MDKDNDVFIKAKILHQQIYKEGKRIVEVAKEMGITPSYICHLLRLNRLPSLIVDGYYSKVITLSHLFVISRIKDKQELLKLYEKILAENLTVAATEEAVREIIHRVKTKGNYLSKEEIDHYTNKLKSYWKNVEVKIIQTRIKAKIVLNIKGNLQDSTAIVKKILKKLTDG